MEYKMNRLDPGSAKSKAFISFAITGSLLGYSCSSHHQPNPVRPNIIIILSDDIGYSDIGCMGSEIRTPNLDRLAENGIKFTHFYNTARSSPSRASLLTGLYSHEAGMGHLATRQLWDEPGYRNDLSKTTATIAELLRKEGYSTYMTGKWHLSGLDYTRTLEELASDKSNWPQQRGFDRYFGNLSGSCSYYDPYSLVSNNTFITHGKDFYYTDAISDTTVKYIMENPKGKPFFFYVAYTAAHWPLHAPEKEIEKYNGVYDAGWDSLRAARFDRMKKMGIIGENCVLSPRSPAIPAWKDETMKEWQARRMQVYAAMVDIMDQGIGRIIAALEAKGELDNTIIMYMQDNGGCAEPVFTLKPAEPLTEEQKVLKPFPYDQVLPVRKPEYTRDGRFIRQGRGVMAGDADTWVAYGEDWANLSNTPYRFYKSMVHEGGIISPLIVHWPAGIKEKGIINNDVTHLIDILPTCLEITSIKYPSSFNSAATLPLEGLSLVPAFNNKSINREFLFWEHEGNRAIRTGKWKLVEEVKKPMSFTADDENKWELYNLESDPTEMVNLAAKYPAKVKELSDKWESEALRVKAKPWPWDKQ